MKRLAAFLVIGAFSLVLWLLKPYLFLPSGTSVISWWHADAINECAHEPSIGRANYWVPTAGEIADLEIKMAWVIAEREKAGLMVPPPGQRFVGQYIGFKRKNARLIYGNFLPSAMVDDEPWTSRWSPFEKPICVADGGRHFWGIVYNPETKEVEQPKFNGPG